MKDRKCIRLLLNLSVFFAVGLGIWVCWRFKEGMIEKDVAMFKISVISSVFFFFQFVGALITGECVAKGVTISKKDLPALYFFTICAIFVICTFSIAYAVYSYFIIL